MQSEEKIGRGDACSVTGDLVTELRHSAQILAELYPSSVAAFALWSALFEIEQMLTADEQGISTAEAKRIDLAFLASIRILVNRSYLSRLEVPPTELVSSIVSALNEFRRSAHGS